MAFQPRVENPITLQNFGQTGVSAPGTATGAFTPLGNGTFTAGDAVPQTGNWYLPTTANIGVNYWMRVTKTLGDNNTSGSALASWIRLDSPPSWTWQVSPGPGSLSATITVEIATDAGGVNIVASKSGITVSVSVV